MIAFVERGYRLDFTTRGSVASGVVRSTKRVDSRSTVNFPLFGKGGCHRVVDALAASSYRPRRPVVLIGGFSHHTDLSLFGQSGRGRDLFSHRINATQCACWKVLPRANVDNLRSVLSGAASVEYTGLHSLTQSAACEPPLRGVLTGGNLDAMLNNLHKAEMLGLTAHLTWPVLHPFFEGINDELDLGCRVRSEIQNIDTEARLQVQYVFERTSAETFRSDALVHEQRAWARRS